MWAGEVRDCNKIENILHNAFRDKRVNPKREFFNIAADQVIPILKELSVKEITSTVDKALSKNVSKEEHNAAKQYHRPVLNFEEMGIPVGSTLVYVKDLDVKVKVQSHKKVIFGHEEYSLTALTRKLLDLPYNVAPCRYWLFESKNLQDIYDSTYANVEF